MKRSLAEYCTVATVDVAAWVGADDAIPTAVLARYSISNELFGRKDSPAKKIVGFAEELL